MPELSQLQYHKCPQCFNKPRNDQVKPTASLQPHEVPKMLKSIQQKFQHLDEPWNAEIEPITTPQRSKHLVEPRNTEIDPTKAPTPQQTLEC